MMFQAMELELRKHLSASSETTNLAVKDKITKTISANEDVLFFWSIVSVNWTTEEADALLTMIIEHWIVVRGFSFTSAFLERYKQTNKITVQKSKGLRKNLLSTHAED